MPLSIKDPEADRLARALARRTGETLTEAAINALRERLERVAWLAAAVACGLVIGTFTPIGIALIVPLEYRFAFSPSDSRTPPDYPKARINFSGFSAPPPKDYWLKIFDLSGGDPARIYVESRPSPGSVLTRPEPRPLPLRREG
jgi:hypothetical protein